MRVSTLIYVICKTVSTHKTQLKQTFDPETIQQLKVTSAHDISIGGPDLAVHAFQAGLIDEVHLFLIPVIIGGGKPALPLNLRVDLELVEERRFGNGTIYLRYRTKLGSEA